MKRVSFKNFDILMLATRVLAITLVLAVIICLVAGCVFASIDGADFVQGRRAEILTRDMDIWRQGNAALTSDTVELIGMLFIAVISLALIITFTAVRSIPGKSSGFDPMSEGVRLNI